MQKIKKVSTILIALVFIATILAGCGGGAKQPEQQKSSNLPKFLKVVSTTPGGAVYPINVAHNSHIEKLVPGISTRLTPGGSTANVKAISMGQADFGFTHNAVVGAGRLGAKPFDKKYENNMHLLTGGPAALFLAVRKDSKINKIEDLRNKRIGFAPQGYLSNVIAEQLFEVAGFTLEDIKKAGGTIGYYGLQEGPGMLADGQIDLYLGVGPWPATVLMEVDYNPGIKLLTIDSDLANKFFAKYSYYAPMTIPKGTYKSVDYDVKTVGSYWCLVANKSMSEEMAYLATKAFWENLDDIKGRAIDAKGASLETALSNVSIPVHPGALKYYNEKGIKANK